MENALRTQRLLTALYVVWFFIHLSFFLYSAESPDSIKFWPFNTKDLSLANTYDISEFLTYTTIPLAFAIIYLLLKPSAYSDTHSHRNHTNLGFFIAFLTEKINVEERDQKINELTGKPVDYTYLNELKKDKETASSKGVKTWIDRVAVKDKYKTYEQDYK